MSCALALRINEGCQSTRQTAHRKPCLRCHCGIALACTLSLDRCLALRRRHLIPQKQRLERNLQSRCQLESSLLVLLSSSEKLNFLRSFCTDRGAAEDWSGKFHQPAVILAARTTGHLRRSATPRPLSPTRSTNCGSYESRHWMVPAHLQEVSRRYQMRSWFPFWFQQTDGGHYASIERTSAGGSEAAQVDWPD